MTGIRVEGGRDLHAAINTAIQVYGRPEPLLKQLGTYVLGQVGRNFAEGGRPAWKPLAESTRLGRRAGKKGGAQTGKPLQNTGALRRSFELRVDHNRAVVSTDHPVAVFHEYGTRGPYEIKPRNAKALALPFLPGRDAGRGHAGTGKAGRFSFAGLGRATRGADTRLTATSGPRAGKTVAPYTNAAFYRTVTHPGLVARPMLPNPETIGPDLTRVAEVFLARALLRRAAR